MFGSDSPLSRVIFATLALLFGLVTSPRSETSLGTAEAFVRTAYEDLMGEDLAVSVTLVPVAPGNPQDWSHLPEVFVRFDERGRQTERPKTAVSALEVTVGVDGEGTLWRVRSKGSYLKTPELDSMVGFALAHSTWSNDALTTELKRRGARFADNVDAFEARANLRRFEPFVGRIVESDSKFAVRVPSSRAGLADSFVFLWEVELRTQPEPGQTVSVVLMFEPFGGRLLSLNRSLY